MNRYILLGLHVISVIFLALGLVFDILKIDITASFLIDINLFNEKRSIIGTVQSLLESGHYLPFFLIVLFGILIPVSKTLLIFYLLFNHQVALKWYRLITVAGKWAMADVFAVSIFIAFLGARAMRNTTATLEPGFYFFTAYVLLSAIIVGFLTKMNKIALSSHA